MSELPKGWVEANLVDLCDPKQWKVISTAELTDTGYVVYGANGKIGFYSTYTHEAPTLMITCRGATCGNLHVSEPRSYINGNAMALDNLAEQATSVRYLKYALLARGLSDVITGSAQPQITRQSLSEVTVKLAPLVEQTRIAQKLDELLAQVDTLKARIDGIPALLKRFRQSVLAAAVSGRLTEEWRGLQSASLPQSDSADIPVGWSLIPLGSYAANHDGARKPISAKERESRKGDHPYFGATGQIDKIDGYTHDGEFVLVGEDGANLLTRVKPLAFIAKGQIWVNNHAHVIASPSGHSNAYLAIYLNTLGGCRS